MIYLFLAGCVNANHAQRLEYIYGIVAGIVIVTIGLLFLAILVYTHYKLRKRKRQLEEIMDVCLVKYNKLIINSLWTTRFHNCSLPSIYVYCKLVMLMGV